MDIFERLIYEAVRSDTDLAHKYNKFILMFGKTGIEILRSLRGTYL